MRDRSLDEFEGESDREKPADGEPTNGTADGDAKNGETATDGETEAEDDGTAPDGEVDGAGTTMDGDGVDPAISTYSWRSEGAACAACGTVVERRWQQKGDLVCPACKEW